MVMLPNKNGGLNYAKCGVRFSDHWPLHYPSEGLKPQIGMTLDSVLFTSPGLTEEPCEKTSTVPLMQSNLYQEKRGAESEFPFIHVFFFRGSFNSFY